MSKLLKIALLVALAGVGIYWLAGGFSTSEGGCTESCADCTKNSNSQVDMKQANEKVVEARFIRNLEQLRDSELRAVLRDKVEPTPIAHANWAEKNPYAPKVEFRIAHSDDALVIMFDVEEVHTRAIAMENHGRVWEDSCVEFFVGNPLGEGYYNFEINCIGTILASYHLTRAEATPFTNEQLAQVRRFGSLPHEPIDLRGENKWWLCEVIPFKLLGLDKAPETLRANFYKCGDKTDKPHYMSWSPVAIPEPDFHRPDFFGTVKLM